MSVSIPQPGSQRHWDSLDAVRGIAAFLVLTFHCAQLSTGFATRTNPLNWAAWLEPWTWLKYTPLRLLVSAGPSAVVLFFVLSGFVLTLPFLRTHGGPSYGAFAIKRICRIYPPFAAAILLSAVLYALVRPTPIIGASEWFNTVLWDRPLSLEYIGRNLLMTGLRPDMTLDLVMWSLVHELRISLVFPLLYLLTRRFPSLTAAASLLVAILCTRALAGREATDIATSLADTMRFVPVFVAGIILALNLRSIAGRVAGLPAPVQAGLWLGAFLLLLFPGPTVSDYYDFIWGGGAITLIVLVIASARADRFLSTAPLRWLGRVSYSLYLIHVPLLVAFVHVTSGWLPLWLAPVCVIPLSLVAAELAYRAVEAPSIHLGRVLSGLMRTGADRSVSSSKTTVSPGSVLGAPAADGSR